MDDADEKTLEIMATVRSYRFLRDDGRLCLRKNGLLLFYSCLLRSGRDKVYRATATAAPTSSAKQA